MILIDSWPYDLLVSGEISLESDITSEPVESGSNISDHVRPLPPVLSLESIVSDTPIGEIANHETRRIDEVSLEVFGADHIPLPSDEAYKRLTDIRDTSKLVTVEIPVATRSGKPGKRTFTDMVIQHLSIPLGPDNHGGLRFSVTFQQLKIVKNKRTTIRVAVRSPAKGAVNKGLSLDKLVEGNDVLWRKGNPPGRSPATDPPGVITGTEVVFAKNGKIYHSDKKTELTTPELQAFTADLNRDTALMTNRKLAVIDKRIDDLGNKIDRAIKLNDYNQAKADNPGKYIDPALFGL